MWYFTAYVTKSGAIQCDLVVLDWMDPVTSEFIVIFSNLFRRVNRLEPARILRKLFPRPSFIPDTVNVERFILVDEPKAPQYKLVRYKIII